MKFYRYAGGTMKRTAYILIGAWCLLLPLMFIGCGGSGSGSPGSKGTEDTGVIVDAFIVPVYLGGNTNSVDVFQDLCDPGPPPEFEPFTTHSALVTFTARLININPTIQPGNLYIEKYTIRYFRNNDSIGAPPIETYEGFKTITITPPLEGEGVTEFTDTLTFVDLVRKDQYAEDILTGQYTSSLAYINNYTAFYTFQGKNEYGEKFKFEAQVEFEIGSFLNC
jgi:hypothetical protein